MKSRFKNRMAAESIPQHIYQMDAILDTAQQKMDALEQRIADFKEYQTKIQEIEGTGIRIRELIRESGHTVPEVSEYLGASTSLVY